MKYLRLHVTNYRGITTSEVSFLPTGITLVQGPNEVGKTSLGEAINILFEYPDNSKNRDIQQIRPVHRDEGPEIELQAETGPYAFTYFKRFYKKPETKLTITRPKPENLTGRDAHDRALGILRETLDIDLWKALTIQQGNAIQQPALGKQTSLSAALDKAAGTRPLDPQEESLFGKVKEEYLRYYTEKGAEKKDLQETCSKRDNAQDEVSHITEAIRDLEKDIDQAALLQNELRQLRDREHELLKEDDKNATALAEVWKLESVLSTAQLKLDTARKSEVIARRDKDLRRELIVAVEEATGNHKEVAESSAIAFTALSQADDELRIAQTVFDAAEQKRKEADTITALRRADYDYYNNKLHLEQLTERKARIDNARKIAAQAQLFLDNTKVNKKTLKAIQDAERAFLTASAQLAMGAPSITLRGLSECTFQVNDADVSLQNKEIKTIAVPDKTILIIPDILEVEISAGSSTDDLSRKLAEAKQSLDKACSLAGVATPEEAIKEYEKANEASRQINSKDEIERENLRDLSYDDLERKLYGLQVAVPDYLLKRSPEPAICTDLESAKIAWTKTEVTLKEAIGQCELTQAALDTARNIREGLNTQHREVRVQLDMLASELKQKSLSLENARNVVSDASLEAALFEAQASFTTEKARVDAAEATLKEKNPERIKALADTVKGSLKTTQDRRSTASTELTEVQTRLKIHGEEGLYERLQVSQTHLERISYETDALLQRAAAARLLFETMRGARDNARQAYIKPLKEKIEGLGRLVFDESLQVDITDDLQIASRTYEGVTVPFDSLSGGTKEQLSLIFRLACAMIVAKDGGTPLILDDTLGYTDHERLKLMGAVMSKAAKECQIVIFTCVPDRYRNIGEASVVALR
jgi:hypothetical protein